MRYELHSGTIAEADYTPYGGVREFFTCRDSEVIMTGGNETGKTLGALMWLHILACKYPRAHMAIVRKTQASMPSTVLRTLEEQVLGEDSLVQVYGGQRPEQYIYPNGTVIRVGGLDKPSKILSAEYDIAYVNQAEELTNRDWEILTTRTTGRAGHMPYSQCVGDCNPSHPSHWILERQAAGALTLIETDLKDNPTLWDHVLGEWTEQGWATMGVLDKLTGALKERMRYGKWRQEEGAVYDEFTRRLHVGERDAALFNRYVVGVDEGYTNPAAALVMGIDSDGRLHAVKEFYETELLQDGFVDICKGLAERYQPVEFWADPSAAGLIAAMKFAGLTVHEADNRVYDGIQKVKNRLAEAGDGLPRLTFSSFCVNTISELETYAWKPGNKDVPVKENDHAMDALRYVVMGQEGDTEVRRGTSPYDPVSRHAVMETMRQRAGRIHSDTPLHRRWAQKHFCLQCYNEYEEGG